VQSPYSITGQQKVKQPPRSEWDKFWVLGSTLRIDHSGWRRVRPTLQNVPTNLSSACLDDHSRLPGAQLFNIMITLLMPDEGLGGGVEFVV